MTQGAVGCYLVQQGCLGRSWPQLPSQQQHAYIPHEPYLHSPKYTCISIPAICLTQCCAHLWQQTRQLIKHRCAVGCEHPPLLEAPGSSSSNSSSSSSSRGDVNSEEQQIQRQALSAVSTHSSNPYTTLHQHTLEQLPSSLPTETEAMQQRLACGYYRSPATQTLHADANTLQRLLAQHNSNTSVDHCLAHYSPQQQQRSNGPALMEAQRLRHSSKHPLLF
jgi:hypothetical protein